MNVPSLALDLAIGLLAGGAHVALLRRNTALYLRPGRIAPAIALQVLRLGLLATVLALLARQGAPALLAGALGVLVARHLVLRRLTWGMR